MIPNTSYFSYIHCRPNGLPFYVGKGKIKRATSVKYMSRSKHYDNVVAKHGADNILIGKFECSTEAIAFELEIGLIKCFRRMGVALTNLTNGGDGASGCVQSEATKAKISASLLGKKNSEQSKARLSAAKMGVKGVSPSKETRAKLSAAMMGRETTAETRAKLSAANTGKKYTAERCAKMSADGIGRKHTAATCVKMAVSGKAAWLRKKNKDL